MIEETERVTLSESQFCKAVGISRVTAYRLRQKGVLPHLRVGSKVLYLDRHITEFLEASERKARRPKHA